MASERHSGCYNAELAYTSGPGWCTPEQAIAYGKKHPEKIVYVQCIQPDATKPDYLATINVDPSSPQFCTVLHRTKMRYNEDELHHSGWNACSSCHTSSTMKRDKLILPSLKSDRVYIIDMAKDPLAPEIHKVIEPEELHKLDLSAPHTSHCLADGKIMISTMGKKDGSSQGSFLVLDGADDFKVVGEWSGTKTSFGYDFWYQPCFNIMVSSEWGAPSSFKQGFNPDDVTNGKYGKSLHFWDWNKKTLTHTYDLGPEGWMPLETRFLHQPRQPHGFVGCALSSSVFHIHETPDKKWTATKVIQVDPLKVTGWALPEMPGLITDILISMDDKNLFFSNWAHGDIRWYDISNPAYPKLVSRLYIGGSIVKGGPVVVVGDEDNQPEQLYVQGRKIVGGPQMLQLSLDGERLYVTTSLFKAWDQQFYPGQVEMGSVMLQVDVKQGRGLCVNQNFLVDFGKEPDGPVLAHEVRYPGGDCSSDIFPCPGNTY